MKAGAEAEKRGWDLSKKKNLEYLDLLKKNGMTIHVPSPQLKADMQKVGATMQKDAEPRRPAPKPGQAVIVDAYKKK